MGRLRGAVVRPIAFLFPGQGSQQPGMGKALAEAFPESRAVFAEADATLSFPLSRICFEGSDAELARTENTQPAVLAASIAALRALESRGVVATAAAGHSLGEYSAHVLAGTLAFADAVRVVRQRGRFMQEAVPLGEGAMAAILGLARESVDRICREVADGQIVSSANLNGPDQVVIAGHAPAVSRAAEASRLAGARRVIPLAVSAPFHCSLMEPARERLARVLEGIPFSDPSMPVYANVDGEPVSSAGAARDALVRQVVAPVRWEDLVERMVAAGIHTFVEVGPGRVLAGLVRRIAREVRVLSVEDPEGVASVARELGGGR